MYAELDLQVLMAGRASNDNPEPSRRKFPRRGTDKCVLRMDGKTYPIRDWSRCGVLLEADGREFAAEKAYRGSIAFYTPGAVLEATLDLELVRASEKLVAFNFLHLAEDADRLFDHVIDQSFYQAMDAVQAN